MRHQANQRSFQLAHIRTNILRDIQRHVRRQGDFLLLGFLLQNCHLRLEIRRLDVCNQSPLKPAAQPVFNLRQFFRRTVARDHDLPHRVVKRIEGMEEFFLRSFLAGKELNVVDQQHVHAAELVAEGGHLVVAQRVDHVIRKLLARYVTDGRLRLAPLHFVPNSLHQVGLAHADAAIQEQRVVSLRRTLRHRLARCMRELVAAADYECIERVARI